MKGKVQPLTEEERYHDLPIIRATGRGERNMRMKRLLEYIEERRMRSFRHTFSLLEPRDE